MTRTLAMLVGCGAGALSAASGAAFLDLLPGWGVLHAMLLHLAAVILGAGAARLRTPSTAVELDTVVITSMFVPVFGPALAWTFPRLKSEDDVEGAHAVFEAYERSTEREKTTYQPPLYTGDFEKDLSRELNTVSYLEVLRHGTIDQKRNLLRSLGRRAEPRHLEMIRKCLLDADHEIRLCAYAEIDRLGRIHETKIADLKALCQQPNSESEIEDPATALAEAQLDFAVSGVLDIEMARFWMREAIKQAEQQIAAGGEAWRAARVVALAHAELEEYDEAMACLRALPPPDSERAETLLTCAEVAFKQRDYATARIQAAKLRHMRLQLPAWLSALGEPTALSANDMLWAGQPQGAKR